MGQNWIVSISSDDWNFLVEKPRNEKVISSKVSLGDSICLYVRESSSIKGIAKLSENNILVFQKIGDLNFFGILDSLEFVKDKDNAVKYLKNFNGVSNLGKPISARDMDVIMEHMIPAANSKAIMEPEIPLENKFAIGSDYEKMFKLENALRKFIVTKLETISKNWVKERAPNQEAVKKWNERHAEHKKQNKWFNEKNFNLIQFSDFPDLLTLIISRKNWKDCFEDTFGHRTIFEGKMIELANIRNDIAHNRELGQEEKDALDLYSRQIFKLLGLE